MRALTLYSDGEPVKLNELTKEEVHSIYELYKIASDAQQRRVTNQFYAGQNVWFMHQGSKISGVVIKVNVKTIGVRTDSGNWKVSASLLKCE